MSLFPLTQFDFPNVSAYDSDLREVLRKLKLMSAEMRDFMAVNKITNGGAWDITKQYKPWTIVSDNNAGYLSMKPVPAGIEINNIEYWAPVADYDILITDLSSRISTLEGKTAALEADNVINKNTINQIDEMFYSIDYLSTKKYIMIGDSYAEFSDSWQTRLKQKLNLTEGTNAFSSAVGGTGFVNGSPTWVETIENIIAPSDVDYIIVAGGYNDRGGVGLSAAIHSFITTANTRFPNAKVLIGMCAWNAHTYDPWIVETYLEYKNACRDYGAIYMDNIEYTLHNYSYVNTDGFHPVSAGSESIYKHMIEFLQKGHADVYIRGSGTVENASDIGGTINYNYALYNGHTTLNISLTHFTASPARSFSFANSAFGIGTIKSTAVGRESGATIPCYLHDDGTLFYTADAMVFINNCDLYISTLQTNDARNNFRSPIPLTEFGGTGRVTLTLDSMTQI